MMTMNEAEIRDLQTSIERSKIDRANSLTFEERLRAGAELYDEGMRWMSLMIRADNPTYDDEQIDAEIERRKKIVRKIDDCGMYQPCGMAEIDDKI